MSIQSDLIWTGDYADGVDGDFGPRAIAAVKAFQKRSGSKDTGVLNPKERGQLATAAKRRREAAGWRTVNDSGSGARLGIPAKLAPQHNAVARGSRWTSARGEVQIETFRIDAPGTTLQGEYEAQRSAPERKITYNVMRSDFFVVSGLQGLKKLYVRGETREGQVRGFSIAYDQAMEGALNHVVIAMSSAFEAFPTAVATAPPPRRKVEYGSGVFVSAAGHVVTTRDLIDGCQTFSVGSYGPADLVADHKDAGLALLRVYGARELKPLALAEGPSGGEVTLVGVSDPARQGGAGNVSTVPARIVAAATGQRPAIEPIPALGFAGAAALDRSGRLAGIADVSVQLVAGAAPQAAGGQATLISAAVIKKFLADQNVNPVSEGYPDAVKAAVARVICVRK